MINYGNPQTQVIQSFDDGTPLPEGWVVYLEEDKPASEPGIKHVPRLDWEENSVIRRWNSIQMTEDEIKIANRKIWPQAVFWAKFTQDEQLAIVMSTDPIVALLRYTMSLHADIWSDDERVNYGLTHLVELGVLSEERKAAILS